MVTLSAKMNKTTPHNNQIHFLVQEIPGPVETKPPTEFDQTPSSRTVMQYIRAVNQGGWLARLGCVHVDRELQTEEGGSCMCVVVGSPDKRECSNGGMCDCRVACI